MPVAYVFLSPVYTIQPVVKPVVKPVVQPVVSCKRGITDHVDDVGWMAVHHPDETQSQALASVIGAAAVGRCKSINCRHTDRTEMDFKLQRSCSASTSISTAS